MIKQMFLLSVLLVAFVQLEAQQKKHVLVIHGGAGVIEKDKMPIAVQKAYTDVLDRALSVGDSVLRWGGTSLDAVERTIMILEDSPLFNAGKGAVLTHDGIAELDASVMDGASLKAGAIAGVRDIKNPISVARGVMEKSEHVMLSGAGASQFAKEQGYEIVDNSYFITEKHLQSLRELQNKERAATQNDKHGTVGCAALDIYGNIAAGTSTGGMMNKKYGRIGDSPIIGAGTYANNQTGAFSCTGHGEYYIRLGFARDISALIEYKKMNISDACTEEIRKLTQLGGTGGVIGLDRQGNIAMKFNTPGMFRGFIKSDGSKKIAIFNEE
jgi:beta-aspartyl-peptidase (threonine type)